MALNPRHISQQRTYDAAHSADIDAGLRSYMLRVYNLMALGVGFTGLITLAMANMPGLMQTLAMGPMKWVLLVALIGMGFFSGRIITMQSNALAQAFYWVYCALWGVMISPMIFYFLNIENGVYDIARAFFVTAGMFAGASLYGYTTKRDLSGIGRFLMFAIIGVFIASLVQLIFFEPSVTFGLITSCLFVLLFAGMTAWETQEIKSFYFQVAGQDNVVSRFAILGALMLYGSFVVMFINLLQIFGLMRDE